MTPHAPCQGVARSRLPFITFMYVLLCALLGIHLCLHTRTFILFSRTGPPAFASCCRLEFAFAADWGSFLTTPVRYSLNPDQLPARPCSRLPPHPRPTLVIRRSEFAYNCIEPSSLGLCHISYLHTKARVNFMSACNRRRFTRLQRCLDTFKADNSTTTGYSCL